MSDWTIIQYDAAVPATITERFCEWLIWVLSQARGGKVTAGKPIALTLTKPNGEPYSDSTFHTQVNTVLHRRDMVERYPDLKLFRVRYLHKRTTLYLTKVPTKVAANK